MNEVNDLAATAGGVHSIKQSLNVQKVDNSRSTNNCQYTSNENIHSRVAAVGPLTPVVYVCKAARRADGGGVYNIKMAGTP